jgi:hypothetical protein
VSPVGRPYILCTVDHRPGSRLPPTFIVSVDILEKGPQVLRQKIKPLPDTVVGPAVVAGVASPNGRFLVVVEKETMKLLTLRGPAAAGGGLTCTAAGMIVWETKLRTNGADASIIAIQIEEQKQTGALEIIAVDGRGHIAYPRISVPEMTEIDTPPSTSLRNPMFLELSSEGTGRPSIATSDPIVERREIVPG